MLKQNLAKHVYINYNYVLCCKPLKNYVWSYMTNILEPFSEFFYRSYSSKYFQHDLYKIVLFDKLKKHEIYE